MLRRCRHTCLQFLCLRDRMVMKMWLGFTERLKLFMYALHVWFVLYWKHLLQHWLRAVRQTALIIDLWQVMAGPMCWVFLKVIRLCNYFRGSNSIFISFLFLPQNAQHVEVESIPLPDMPHAPSNILIQDIPLPGAQPPSILKKTSAYG